MKAKWIPSEQIVELQTPAVSTVSSSETNCQYTHPVISLCYYKMLVQHYTAFVWMFCYAGKVLADDGLFYQWQAASPPWRSSLPDGVCECQIEPVYPLRTRHYLYYNTLRCLLQHVIYKIVQTHCVNRETCRCFTRTCRCPSRTGTSNFCPRAQWASSSIRYKLNPDVVTEDCTAELV